MPKQELLLPELVQELAPSQEVIASLIENTAETTAVPFLLESQLRTRVSQAWPLSALVGHSVDVITEFRVGAVIPDLLVVNTPPIAGGAVKRLTMFESHLLALLLSGKPQTVNELARALYTRPVKATAALNQLARKGLVHLLSGERYSFRRGSFPLSVELTAIEAKLTRWKDAIKQAIAYLSFSNRAFVALPENTLDSCFLPILDTCIQSDIGLLSVSGHSIELVFDAPRHYTRTADWLWTVARVLTKPTESESEMEAAIII